MKSGKCSVARDRQAGYKGEFLTPSEVSEPIETFTSSYENKKTTYFISHFS
jgi:hypothetical protein